MQNAAGRIAIPASNVPYPSTSYVLWTDPNTGGTTHTYRVTSVDTHAAESAMSNSVTR